MPRLSAPGLALVFCSLLLAPPANAVVKGTSSSLGSYTVRLVGPYFCSGVAIGRQLVATAAHCAHRGMRVQGGGGAVGIAAITRSAVLDDGRHVSVTGDAVILKLASPLGGVSAAPIGGGSGDTFTIAGYGTTDERWRGSFGALHEATLVRAEARALVDPNRTGLIGASACYGDSGGPVMRGGVLVGIITRAAHPSPRIACGDLTRWAAISVSGEANANTAPQTDIATQEPASRQHRRQAKQKHETQTASTAPFGNWFSEQVETKRIARKSTRHRSVER
jgi:hypothetical protein